MTTVGILIRRFEVFSWKSTRKPEFVCGPFVCLLTCLLCCCCCERLSQKDLWSLRLQVHTSTAGWKWLIHDHLFLTSCKVVKIRLQLSRSGWLSVTIVTWKASISYFITFIHWKSHTSMKYILISSICYYLPPAASRAPSTHLTQLHVFFLGRHCMCFHIFDYLKFISKFALFNWQFSSDLALCFLLDAKE